MEFKKIIVGSFFLLTGCTFSNQGIAPADHGVRDVCISTVCNSLENSGERYQRRQQGYFLD